MKTLELSIATKDLDGALDYVEICRLPANITESVLNNDFAKVELRERNGVLTFLMVLK